MDLSAHRFLSYFEPEHAARLCDISILETFPEQTTIFEEGEIPDYLYLVLVGQVAFSKRTDAGKYQVVALANPNDFFGEFGVLDGQPRSARASACGGATLAKIPRDKLMEILNDSKGSVVLNLFGYIIHHLRATTDQYVKQLVYKEKMVLVGEMVNTIIHDFKSPFTGIQLSSAMIKELHEDEETQEWCDLIQVQVMRMLGMAEEVLDFTKGHSLLDKKEIVLNSLVKQFEKLNRVYFQSTQVKFTADVGEVVVYGDDNKLLRVFQNLVGNAVEAFDGQGGIIHLIAEETPQWVKIRIEDNGPGIPEEIKEHLFDPFVTHGKRGGTGLGTAISKSIIDAHGGQIEFISEGGAGTMFLISLPRN